MSQQKQINGNVKSKDVKNAQIRRAIFYSGIVGLAVSIIAMLVDTQAFGQTYSIDEIVAEVAHDLNCYPSTLCSVVYNGTHIIVTHLPDYVGDFTQTQVFKPEQTNELFGPQRETSNSIEGDENTNTEVSYLESVAEVNDDNGPEIAYCNEAQEICVNIEDGKITNPVDSYYTMMYEKFGNFEDMATDFVDPFDTIEGDYVAELQRDYNKLSDSERMTLGDAANFVKERNNIPADDPTDNEDEDDEYVYFNDYPEVGIKANAQLAEDNQNAIASNNNDNENKNSASNDNGDNDENEQDTESKYPSCDGHNGNGICHDESDVGDQEGTTVEDNEDNDDKDVTEDTEESEDSTEDTDTEQEESDNDTEEVSTE